MTQQRSTRETLTKRIKGKFHAWTGGESASGGTDASDQVPLIKKECPKRDNGAPRRSQNSRASGAGDTRSQLSLSSQISLGNPVAPGTTSSSGGPKDGASRRSSEHSRFRYKYSSEEDWDGPEGLEEQRKWQEEKAHRERMRGRAAASDSGTTSSEKR